jgi:hypothetical protein
MQTYPHCYSSVPALFSHLKLYEGTVQQSDVTCERCNVSIVAAQFISVYLDHYGKVPLVAELNCSSDACQSLSDAEDRNKWFFCLPCLTKFNDRVSFRRHEKRSKKHKEKFVAYSTKFDVAAEAHHLHDVSMQLEESSDNIFDIIMENDGSEDEEPFVDNEKAVGKEPSRPSDWIMEPDAAGPRHPKQIPLQDLEKVFCNKSKAAPFFHYESLNPEKGARFLTAKAFDQVPEDIGDEEAQFSLKVAFLLTCMTGKEQDLLADILLDVANSKHDEHNIFKCTRVPTSRLDFREIYLTGKNAILPNLPHPVVHSTKDESHAYVNVLDVLAWMLAKATPMERFDDSAQISNNDDCHVTVASTRAARELYMELREELSSEMFVLYLWFREWSDDFDPSHTKSNRAQVWLKTFTVCPPEDCSSDVNTAFIAMGSKGDDHEDMEHIITEQLKELARGNGKVMYHGGLNRLIHVKGGIVSTCVDRPERTKLFGIGDHNGTYSVCWGFAAQVDGSRELNCLPSCPFCRKNRLLRYTGRQADDSQREGVGNSSHHILPSTATMDAYSGSHSNQIEEQEAVTSSAGGLCPNGTCSSWNLLDPKLTFPAPARFPIRFDTSHDAPAAPLGREILPHVPIKERSLHSVYITIPWLKQAVQFAFHNHATFYSGSARFWNKAQFEAFLRTCSFVKKLQSEIARCVRQKLPCPTPTLWTRGDETLRRCHYAAMHMLFLGHVKSNFLMMEKWLKRFELFTQFGMQANIILQRVQKLRLHRFNAHPLSSSSYGPGAWVSENQLFWARASKYFFTLPAIQACKHADKAPFLMEKRIAQRFIAAAAACIGKLMTDKRGNSGMSTIIKIYLDTMVEMDDLLLSRKPNPSAGEEDSDGEEENGVGRMSAVLAVGQSKSRKAAFNFVKSNSLGILAAADAHDYFGPAILNWEGGFGGERKIQDVKPLLGIRRSNAKWESIVMTKLYQQETIQWMLTRYASDRGVVKQDRACDGLYSIFKSRADALNAISERLPMSAILSKGVVWLTYRPSATERPVGERGTRSQVGLLRVYFDDENGKLVCGCWMAPINVGPSSADVAAFPSVGKLEDSVRQHVLMLPALMLPDGAKDPSFANLYYCLGDKWTERNNVGSFVDYSISDDMFRDWE